MRIGLYVTIIYIALALGGGFITEQADNLTAIGVSGPWQALSAGFLDKVSTGIGIVATSVGLALPSIQKGLAREENKAVTTSE